ncbi:MAG: hypothetical protein O3B64_00665 [bacterium]|nr:hypothetical protein [bacterium]MDA1024455.1 hypothetical protein [bacterium]
MPKYSLISVSDQLHGAWTLYKANIKRLTLIACLFSVPMLFSVIGEIIAPTASLGETNFLTGQGTIRFILDILGGVIVGPLITVIGVGLTIHLSLGLVRGTAPKKLVLTAKEYLQLLITGLVKFLLVAIPVILVFVPGIILLVVNADTAKIPLLSLVGIAYIVLSVIAALVYLLWVSTIVQLTEFVVLANNQTVIASMKYLRTKIRGQFWAIFGRIFIPKLLIGLTAAFAVIVIQALFSFALLEGISSGNPAAIQLNIYVGFILGFILILFTGPLIYLADALLFDSLEKQS